MANYFVINISNTYYVDCSMESIDEDNIEVAFGKVFTGIMEGEDEAVADVLFQQDPEAFDNDYDIALDAARDMNEEQWSKYTSGSKDAGIIYKYELYEEKGLMVLNQKNEFWKDANKITHLINNMGDNDELKMHVLQMIMSTAN